MFSYQAYVNKFMEDYKRGVLYNNSHLAVENPTQTPVYKIIGIHKLTPQENVGKHNLYIEVRDSEGRRPKEPIFINWGWAGQRSNEKSLPILLDKPLSEPYGNIPIWSNQVIWATVGNRLAETVSNVHTHLPDEGPGNTYGHYSYLVVWQEVTGEQEPLPPPSPEEGPIQEIKLKLGQIKNLVHDIEGLLP